ncbi:MAG: NADH:flavin oxidoreductase/NADH oxidase [Pararhodobacter sp.]|nr:NADH:flavin oxidoreductase/NADH oxidase [Pararhodobacter sp.]
MKTPALFSPLSLRDVTLPNRIVVSPMCMYSARDGVADDFHLAHYGKFAIGGAGLVFVEATGVTAQGRITNGCLGLWNDEQAQALAPIAALIKQQGSVAGIQLGHGGRKASTQRAFDGSGPLGDADIARGEKRWQVIGPSPIAFAPGWLTPREMTRADMDDVRDAFVRAAGRAVAAGFQLVELHMAHGYLLQSFLTPLANQRRDGYGGALENRMRFPLEVAEAVRRSLPDGMPLFARISAVDWVEGGWQMPDSIVLARALQRIGVDVVDCSSGGNLAQGATNSNLARGPAFQAPFAREIRSAVGIKTQAVGLIRDAALAEKLLAEGSADLIALGRQMLYDPFWVLHARRELAPLDDFADWPAPYGWWLEKWARGLAGAGERV